MNDNAYFFGTSNKDVEGSLDLEDLRNNLVYTSKSPIGVIHYNFSKDSRYYSFSCHKIYFRLPGEHIIDNATPDMEIQFNCTGLIPGEKDKNKYVFTAMAVKIVENNQKQSTLFDSFQDIIDKEITIDKLPFDFKINQLDDVLSPFNIYDRIFYYPGSTNYPKCMVGADWIVINGNLSIKRKTYDALFALLDKNQIDNGNTRKASAKKTDYFVLNNKFNIFDE